MQGVSGEVPGADVTKSHRKEHTKKTHKIFPCLVVDSLMWHSVGFIGLTDSKSMVAANLGCCNFFISV